jgi:transposase-like protein
MGRKSKYTIEEKVQAVQDYKTGKRGKGQICNDLGLNPTGTDLYRWVKHYDKYGEYAFVPKKRNNAYTKEFKEMVVQEYLNEEGSARDLAIKYDIPSSETLRKWIISYNSHEELKDYNPKGDVYMTKRRKTTIEERNEIVQYCLEHNKEYKLAAEHFDVSYAQVYQWVQKYLKSGEDGLIDNRGKRKDESQLSELERLRRENERLKRQLELKEREEIILKKLQEVERRRYSPKGNRNRSI